ncbi:hypothetical protein DVH05_001396 [Phytophthora capsici]|nr:hypothetical protein DVH05_005279 [Phytophthora capsici]KAG1706248.1 hypothetical protein DVH05_001396 [Phytophthora capsici]
MEMVDVAAPLAGESTRCSCVTLTQEAQFSLADDMQSLLFEEDLRQSNDVVREETQIRPDIVVAGIRQLTMRHCPSGTRDLLMDELAQLRKKKGVTRGVQGPTANDSTPGIR